MKQTIKFRGYNLKNKRWLYGYYFVNRGKHYIVQDETVNPFAEAEDFEVAFKSIGMYVGEYRGIPVYEGDYIHVTSSEDKFMNYFGFVEYDKEDCRFVVKLNVHCGLDRIPVTGKIQTGASDINKTYWFYYQYKVVGNEYEKNKCASIEDLQKKWFDSMREMELESALLGTKNKDISTP